MQLVITLLVNSITLQQPATLQRRPHHRTEMQIAAPTLCLSMKPFLAYHNRADHHKTLLPL